MTPERVVALAVALVIACGAALASRRTRTTGSRLADPLVLFFAVWALSLALFAVPWIRYTRTSGTAWLAIYGSLVGFLAGATLARRLFPQRPLRPPPPVDRRWLILCWLTTLVLGLIGFAAFLRAVDLVIGADNVVTHPGAVRIVETTSRKFTDAYGLWKLLTYLNIISFLLWTVALRLRVFRGRLAVLAPVGVLSLAVFLFTGDRTLLVTTIVWAALFHLAWRPMPAQRGLLVAATAVVLCLAAFVVLGQRLEKGIHAHPEIRSALTTHVGESLAPAYAYASSEPPTLSKLIADPTRPRTDGALTFLPLVKLAHRLHLAGVPPESVGAFYPIPFETLNLSSWLGNFYLDYGLLGCLLLPMIVAFLATAASRLRTSSLGSASIQSVILLVIAFSPVVNKLSSSLTWELAIAGLCAAALIERREPLKVRLSAAYRDQFRPWPTRLAIALLGIATFVAAGVAVAATQTSSLNLASRQDVLGKLAAAARRAERAYPSGSYTSSPALSSQLHVSDPQLEYLSAGSLHKVPLQVGVVYVDSRRGFLGLKLVGRDGAVYSLRAVNEGNDIKISERVRSPAADLLSDGGFEARSPHWVVRRGASAIIGFSRRRGSPAPPSVVIQGTKRRGLRAATVTQTVTAPPLTSPGSGYVLSVFARSRGLSRPCPPEVKLIYTDGTYDFFLPKHVAQLKGSFGWRRITVEARAKGDLAAVEVFVVDTGTREVLRGTEWLDNVRLTVTQA